MECFIHCHGILHNVTCDKETNFAAKEMPQRANVQGIHWSYCVLQNAEAIGLMELWNELSKI
jgi:hypothetical protein